MPPYRPAYVLIVTACVMLSACNSGQGSTESTGAASSEDFTPVIERVVSNVITPTYSELHDRAVALHDCVETLVDDLADEQLVECQTAWVRARVPWEQSEGFLFGPVADQGLDPAMDSWPVDHQQLDALMASDVTLTTETIASNLGGGLKGFHTIEYLLWGDGHATTIAALGTDARKLGYLEAITAALVLDTQTLRDAWVGADVEVPFGQRFADSGKPGGLYPSQLDAVHELIGGMIGICDEVAFGKIAEPHGTRDPNLIESQFSYNSLLDFADNIRSVQNVYLGSRDGTIAANSLAKVVAKYDPELDEEVREAIEASISAIDAIGAGGVTFRAAILDPARDDTITQAERQIGDLMDLLNGEVLPLFAR